ncbi:hypothetical protein SUGI_0592270 [Cryptomeria japonica]|nr:hypothetical protein SUGI_0592270 [Cryptomeria japonica]
MMKNTGKILVVGMCIIFTILLNSIEGRRSNNMHNANSVQEISTQSLATGGDISSLSEPVGGDMSAESEAPGGDISALSEPVGGDISALSEPVGGDISAEFEPTPLPQGQGIHSRQSVGLTSQCLHVRACTRTRSGRALGEVASDREDGDSDVDEDCVGFFKALLVSFLPFLGSVLAIFGEHQSERRSGTRILVEEVEES